MTMAYTHNVIFVDVEKFSAHTRDFNVIHSGPFKKKKEKSKNKRTRCPVIDFRFRAEQKNFFIAFAMTFLI